uniref:Uncharacterized protein n=1 Tax=Juglanconis sp. TaxID=2041886 RepID=A0A291LIB6_9PEZI|nr:hypothetical protein [Juglanconis sp.]
MGKLTYILNVRKKMTLWGKFMVVQLSLHVADNRIKKDDIPSAEYFYMLGNKFKGHIQDTEEGNPLQPVMERMALARLAKTKNFPPPHAGGGGLGVILQTASDRTTHTPGSSVLIWIDVWRVIYFVWYTVV